MFSLGGDISLGKSHIWLTFQLLFSYLQKPTFELLLTYFKHFGEGGPVAGQADHNTLSNFDQQVLDVGT